MELPYDLDPDELLSIFILRILGYSEDNIAIILHIGKLKVVQGERWIKEANYTNYNSVLMVCDQQAIKRVTARELASCKDIEGPTLVKAAQLTTDDILRHYHLETQVGRKVTKDLPTTVSPAHSIINIGDLKIVPSPIGTKLLSIGPPKFSFTFPPERPWPTYADFSIRLHVENLSEASMTISGIGYTVTINGNFAGTGSVPEEHTIPPHGKGEIDSPFRADFNTAGSVVMSAFMSVIVSKELQIGLTGTAHYKSNSHTEEKPFKGLMAIRL